MKNEIYGIGWYLRRTYNTQDVSAFYLNNLEIPIIRTHNENIVHWCGSASVVGFNQVDKEIALSTPDQSNSLIALFKVESKKRFANTLHLNEETENIPNIPSVAFYKDNEGIISILNSSGERINFAIIETEPYLILAREDIGIQYNMGSDNTHNMF